MTEFDVSAVEEAIEELDGAAAFVATDGDGRVTSQARYDAGEEYGGMDELIVALVMQVAGELDVHPAIVLNHITELTVMNLDAPRMANRRDID